MTDYDQLVAVCFRLTRGGCHASALKLVLAELGNAPADASLLRLAAVVLRAGMDGSTGATSRPGEALTSFLIEDPLLDPVFSECDCHHNCWVDPPDVTGGAAGVVIINMTGGRCPNNHGVFCSEGYEHASFGVGMANILCPVCHEPLERLRAPTGRRPRRVRPVGLPVLAALVFREGMVPPDSDYATVVLKRFCPDLLEPGNADLTIRAFPLEHWEIVEHFAIAAVGQLNSEYLSSRCHLSPIEAVLDGDRVYILRVYAKTSPGGSHFDVPELEGIPEEISSGVLQISTLLKRHVEQVRKTFGRAGATHGQVWDRLIEPTVLEKTSRAVMASTRASLSGERVTSSVAVFDEIVVAITAIPASEPRWALRWLKDGYYAALDTLVGSSGIKPGAIDFAHWIYLAGPTDRSQVHLTLLPTDARFVVWARDLVTETERQKVGLA
jgi:hypothetical protein